jgi:hypothetical protein
MTQNLRNFKGPDPLAKSLDPLGMKTAGTGMSGHAPPELSNSAARSEYVTRATSNNASGLDTVNNPVSEKFASALDHAKEIVSAHPWAAGGTGLAAAGLGAYGVYRAMKANKAAKK